MPELNLFLTVAIPIAIGLPLLAYSFIKTWTEKGKAQWLPVKLKRLHKPMARKLI